MYQEGDQVTIIPIDVAERWNFHEHNDIRFAPAMLNYCGQVATITAIRHWTNDAISYGLDIDNGSWNWILAMFEQVEQVEPTVSFF